MSTSEGQLGSPQRLEDKVRGAMLRWFGHVQRGIMDIFDKGCCIWSYHAGGRGRPQRRFMHAVKRTCRALLGTGREIICCDNLERKQP